MGIQNSKIDYFPLSTFPRRKSMDTKQEAKHFEDLRESHSDKDLSELKEEKEKEEKGTEDVSQEDLEEEVFFKFVILHAEDDTHEALRVQEMLQNQFDIKPGIIFAEMPCGRQHLKNLDDAVNGSAWTIFLLTENFLRDSWCNFQFYTSLMNSVNREHKYNSVIPMRPLNNPLPRDRTPFALQTINALEEKSCGFCKQVEKIFQDSVYEKQKAIWRNSKNVIDA
ncbi:transmembrane emp24 domain-containing protein 7 isoform X1 [Dromiciops gliroides]|uniref:transmembrane emp24 domain-containing protein 7 isoform X1 n=1 Tax=Dromiciops gliroides TaxID=33562 RepID=UPI001CC3A8C3|nr:transmembrane emp24 domain-containing protein 7 isoform X1 [Dromiciops gliroides]